jgi:hypothetical protein
MSSKQKKTVYNLKDVNDAPIFIDMVPRDIMLYQEVNKKMSLFMVEHALRRVNKHNYLIKHGRYKVFDNEWPRLDKCI